jgi:hypothetical protein
MWQAAVCVGKEIGDEGPGIDTAALTGFQDAHGGGIGAEPSSVRVPWKMRQAMTASRRARLAWLLGFQAQICVIFETYLFQ